MSLPIIEQSLLPLLGHSWLKGQQSLTVWNGASRQKLRCMERLFGTSVATNVSLASVDVSYLFGCVKKWSKQSSLPRTDPFPSAFMVVIQKKKLCGVKELFSKETSSIQEGLSCVNVLSMRYQFRLLMKVSGVQLAFSGFLQWFAVMGLSPWKWLHFRVGGAAPMGADFAEC